MRPLPQQLCSITGMPVLFIIYKQFAIIISPEITINYVKKSFVSLYLVAIKYHNEIM